MDKIIRIAVVGYGYWGKVWVSHLKKRDDVQVTLIIDINLYVLDNLFNENIKFYNNYEDVDYDLFDAAIISTPASTHYSICRLFLEKNKSVLCEKPLCTDSYEIKLLGTLADNKNLVLMHGNIYLFNPIIINLKKLINEDYLGKIVNIKFRRTSLGPLRSDVSVIDDLAIHDISILNYWFGVPEIISSSVYKFSKIEQSAHIDLKYKSILLQIDVSWMEPFKERTVKIIGEKKIIVINEMDKENMVKVLNIENINLRRMEELNNKLSIENLNLNEFGKEPLNNEFSHFIKCLRLGNKPNTDWNNASEIAIILQQIKEKETVYEL